MLEILSGRELCPCRWTFLWTGLEMRASFPLVRVFLLFLELPLGVRGLPPGSTAFVQKFSQPHPVPNLPGEEILLVSVRQKSLCVGRKLQMRCTLPISVLHGHLCGFATLRGGIRCSTELTRCQLAHDLGEGLELAKVPGTEARVLGLQDLVQVRGGHRRAVHRPPIPPTTFAAELVGHPPKGVCRENAWVRFCPDRKLRGQWIVILAASTEIPTGFAFGVVPHPELEVSISGCILAILGPGNFELWPCPFDSLELALQL